MRRDPRSGRSPDASLNSQEGKKKWEDALGHPSVPMKREKDSKIIHLL